jgi:hypothetical protein
MRGLLAPTGPSSKVALTNEDEQEAHYAEESYLAFGHRAKWPPVFALFAHSLQYG